MLKYNAGVYIITYTREMTKGAAMGVGMGHQQAEAKM